MKQTVGLLLTVLCIGTLAADNFAKRFDTKNTREALGGASKASSKSALAALGDVPYQVSVWKEWKGLNPYITHFTFKCAGTLIHPEYVLTTCSCVEDAKSGGDKVWLAAGHLNGEDSTGIDFHPLVDHIKHESYDPWTGAHNIALIKVDPPFVQSDAINVVPVRSTPADLDTPCTVSGWKENYSDTSEFLKFDQVRFIAKDECEYLWDERYSYQICAGIPKSEGSVCNVGDEGGPLVCGGQLTGVYCDVDVVVCFDGVPAVYLDAAYYYDWIMNSIAIGPTSTVSTVPTTSSSTTTKTTPKTNVDTNVDVTLGDVPYQVSVWHMYEWNNENNKDFYCVGTLVHNDFVVTTIRCADEASRGGYTVLVAAGHLGIESNSDLDFHPIKDIIRHEDYDASTNANDIALLKVSPEFASSAHVSPATIRTTPVAEGIECTISGWKENHSETSDVLRSSKVNILNKIHCKYLDVDKPEIYVTKLCAGIPKDAPGAMCNVGDEGGPLYCEWQLTGIYSDFAVVCTTPGPGIYLDVAYFSGWILGKIDTHTSATTTTTVMTPTTTTAMTPPPTTTVGTPTTTVGTQPPTTTYITGGNGGGGDAGTSNNFIKQIPLIAALLFLLLILIVIIIVVFRLRRKCGPNRRGSVQGNRNSESDNDGL